MADQMADCKCGKYKQESDIEKALNKENAVLQQRISLLEAQIKEI